VLISDGGNTVNGTDYADALEQAVRSETMVYSLIDVPIAADAGRDTGGEHAMITLSQDTGGKYYYADADHLAAAFQKVSEDLRTQYLLAYYPQRRVADSDYRKISVTLKEPPNTHYSVRHRTGYYATPAK
jgi:Ca-activated chloride channel homolog